MVQHKRFDVEMDGDITILRLNDPKLHEMILITQLHDELLQYIERHHPNKLLVDFALVTFCSSAVINCLLLARKRLMDRQGVIRLCSMHKQVREAFHILRLDGTLFEIYESLTDGLGAFEDE